MNTTILYYTSCRLPKKFLKTTQQILLKAVRGLPIISVSQKPIDFGENICVGDIGISSYNIYKQLLIGAKAAKTKYVATAEDDVLYSPKHFHTITPKPGVFMYDQNRWSIHTWVKPPVFGYKVGRRVLHQLICERDLLIETLEERFMKYPDPNNYPIKYFGEPGRYEEKLGLTPRKLEDFKSYIASVVYSHPYAAGFAQHGKRKGLGQIQALELPHWGTAEQVMRLYD